MEGEESYFLQFLHITGAYIETHSFTNIHQVRWGWNGILGMATHGVYVAKYRNATLSRQDDVRTMCCRMLATGRSMATAKSMLDQCWRIAGRYMKQNVGTRCYRKGGDQIVL